MAKPKLNKNAQKWVRALRSGKYKQGRGVLHGAGDKFCCLGVACNLALESGLKLETFTDLAGGTSYDGAGCYLPDKVRKWLGLRQNTGAYAKNSKSGSTLAHLNDAGKRFTTIARIIESKPEGLFVD